MCRCGVKLAQDEGRRACLTSSDAKQGCECCRWCLCKPQKWQAAARALTPAAPADALAAAAPQATTVSIQHTVMLPAMLPKGDFSKQHLCARTRTSDIASSTSKPSVWSVHLSLVHSPTVTSSINCDYPAESDILPLACHQTQPKKIQERFTLSQHLLYMMVSGNKIWLLET